jgi:drug/metabolite transporter (DMT)-like permease
VEPITRNVAVHRAGTIPAANLGGRMNERPLIAGVLGALLLSEAPSAVQLAGVAIVIAGVAVGTIGPRAEVAAA